MSKNNFLRRFAFSLTLSTMCIHFAFAVAELHPSFSIKHILPTELNNLGGIGGIDLLPNGDGAICSWGGSQKSDGEIWIIPNLASGTPGTAVRIAQGLREPLGLKVVGNDFYVMEKPRILKFTGSGTTWTKSTLWSLPTTWYNDSQWHHFSFNLVFRDNHFWFTTGTAYDYDPNDPLERGALIGVPLAGDGFAQFARGLRNTMGLGIGPDNEFFTTDNQGHWKPVDYLNHIPTTNIPTNGRFFGFRTNGNNACGITAPKVDLTSCPADPEYPPAIWIPYGDVSNSPTRPLLLSSGPFKGQMISGDVRHGGTLRYFLEKVGGEYQGAVFPFMDAGSLGINFGINQFLATPTGSLLVTGIGGGTCNLGGSGNWNWNNTCNGLDLLTVTNKIPFEILAVRSIAGGFDVEFTQPAGAAAATAANYEVRTTVFTPVQEYGKDGASDDNNILIPVSSVVLSSDGKHATIKLATLLTHRMYQIKLKNISSLTNEQPYNNVAYYTLNNVNTSSTISTTINFSKKLQNQIEINHASLVLPFEGAYHLGLYNLDGKLLETISGKGPGTFSSKPLHSGLYLISGSAENVSVHEKIQVF